MKRALGHLERQLFAYTQMRNLQVLRTRDLMGPLNISEKQGRELVGRLSKAGMIAKVLPGLYLVPPRLPLGGKWSPDATLVLDTLITGRQGCYQICGPNAFNRYGFDNQVPVRVYAYNNRYSGERTVAAVSLTLIKVIPKRLGGTDRVRMGTGWTAVYSSRVRTLVDAVQDWTRFNSLPRAFAWILAELDNGRVSAADLVRTTLRHGNVSTIRRIGALLDRAGGAARLLPNLAEALRPTASLIPWDPRRPKRGVLDRRWGVVWNDHDCISPDPDARGSAAVPGVPELHRRGDGVFRRPH